MNSKCIFEIQWDPTAKPLGKNKNLSFSVNLKSVVSSPSSVTGTSLGVREADSLLDSSMLATDGGLSSHLTMLMFTGTDPINFGVVPDNRVSGIDENNFIIFVCSILGYPIGVEEDKTAETSSTSLLK